MKHSLFYQGLIAAVLFSGAVFFSPAALFAEEADQSIVALEQRIAALLAQIASLKEQIAQLQAGTKPVSPVPVKPVELLPPQPPICPDLTRNLFLGAKDSSAGKEVSALQKFLAHDKDIYPEGDVSGFFGPHTRDAVKRWQLKHGVVSPGSAPSAGFGSVGPQTRAALTKACQPPPPVFFKGELTIEPSSVELKIGESVTVHAWYQPPAPPCPEGLFCTQVMPERQEVAASFTSSDPSVAAVDVTKNACDPPRMCPVSVTRYAVRGVSEGSAVITASYYGNTDDDSTDGSAALTATMDVSVGEVHSDKNLPPSIRGVAGPVSLRAGASGTWEVKASDPENQPLSYSVVWGDERFFQSSPGVSAPSAKAIEQTATFTHTYSDVGLYRPVFTVQDSAGNQESASITVSVGTAPSTQGSIKIVVTDLDAPVPAVECLRGDTRGVNGPCPQPARHVLYYAKVSLVDSFGRFITSQDTGQGSALFEDLSPGTYLAKASAPGYREGKDSFTVVAGVAGFLEIPLHRSVLPTPGNGSLSISPRYAVLKVGESQQIKAIFTPARAPCFNASPPCEIAERAPYEVQASFVSDNPKVASIGIAVPACAAPVSAGMRPGCSSPLYSVQGVSEGNALISASYTDGERTYAAKMNVTVTGTDTTSITITTSSDLHASLNKAFSATFVASPGTSSYTWNAADNALPPGLSLVHPPVPLFACPTDSVTGISKCPKYQDTTINLQGVPTQAGTYTFTLFATDRTGLRGSAVFTMIVGQNTTVNNPPKINGIPAVPVGIQAGQSVSFSWGATDADNDNLAWTFDWGDGVPGGFACPSPVPTQNTGGTAVPAPVPLPCGWNVTVAHAWQKAGTYSVKATASDGKGGTDTNALSVNVASTSTPPSL